MAAIQFSKFSNGGFVLHKIKLDGVKSRISAWFDDQGKLLDCEFIPENLSGNSVIRATCYPIRSAKTWAKIQKIGKAYVDRKVS